MNKFTQSIRSKIVRIGNSQGIRIPHALLQQLRLTKDVEMSVQDGQLVIRAARAPREGWEKRFSGINPPELAVSPEAAPAGEPDETAEISTEWDGTGLAW
jgi:antitoxin MazE